MESSCPVARSPGRSCSAPWRCWPARPTSGRPTSTTRDRRASRLAGWRQGDAEPGDGEAQEHLSRGEQVGDARGTEHLQLAQPYAVRIGSGEARDLELGGVVPDL